MIDKTEIGCRRATWLRFTAYPGPHAAKRIQADFNVSHATAERWLAGAAPGNAQLELELARWGEDYRQFVMAPRDGYAPAAGIIALRAIEGGRARAYVPVAPIGAMAVRA